MSPGDVLMSPQWRCADVSSVAMSSIADVSSVTMSSFLLL